MSVLTVAELVRRRLVGHGFATPRFATPLELVTAYGAMQAQEYNAVTKAVAMRLTTDASLDAAIARGEVIRTHPLRNTIHIVAASDVRWILALTAKRMFERAAARYRELALDAATLAKCETVFAKVMANNTSRTRAELVADLTAKKIDPAGQRMPYILHHAELVGLVCSGPRRGKQQTFALMDDRVPLAKPRARADSLVELARRYFAMRSPATVADFAWWSGLAVAEARASIAALAPIEEVLAGTTYYSTAILDGKPRGTFELPAFDEYTVAYKDRSALLAPSCKRTPFELLKPLAVRDGYITS